VNPSLLLLANHAYLLISEPKRLEVSLRENEDDVGPRYAARLRKNEKLYVPAGQMLGPRKLHSDLILILLLLVTF
jgi:hypothetical protein